MNDLRSCSVDSCPNQADRQTKFGPLCPAHRKRTLPSRAKAGSKKLFESVAKREEFLRRWREVALEYAEAETDEQFDAAERKMLSLLQSVLDDGTSELSKAASQLSEARSLAIRRGMARRRNAGLLISRPLSYTRQGVMAALAKTGSVKGAAKLLGCSLNTVYRLCDKGDLLGKVLDAPRSPAPTVPDRPQAVTTPQGEPHAVEAGQIESCVRVESEGGAQGGSTESPGPRDLVPRGG